MTSEVQLKVTSADKAKTQNGGIQGCKFWRFYGRANNEQLNMQDSNTGWLVL